MPDNITPQDVLDQFDFGGRIVSISPYGNGHINDTFAIQTQQDSKTHRYILQRINTHVFKDPAAVMENIEGITNYLKNSIAQNGGDTRRECLSLVYTKDGNSFYRDGQDQAWRTYLLIEDSICYECAETPELFAASATAFGNFARLLQDYPAHTLHETIPHFHDTPDRFANFARAVQEDCCGRAASCQEEIQFVMSRQADCSVLTDLLNSGQLPLRVTHNDTKLNNVLFNGDTGQDMCIIDLDTVMPGLLAYDFGDSIRFGASTAAEDETQLDLVHFSLPLYESYARAYLAAAGSAMTQAERDSLPWGARIITLECGMRFLTDYLSGDTYFKIHRPLHNLDRCRTQFKLVQEMEEQWDAMNQIVAEYAL